MTRDLSNAILISESIYEKIKPSISTKSWGEVSVKGKEKKIKGVSVKIISNGEKSFDLAKKVWSRAVETCVTHNCYKILGIAWVELNSKVIEKHHFIETVLQNHGLPGKLFKNIKEVKN